MLRSIGVWRRECLARVELMFGKVSAWLRPFWLKSKGTKATRGIFSGSPTVVPFGPPDKEKVISLTALAKVRGRGYPSEYALALKLNQAEQRDHHCPLGVGRRKKLSRSEVK